MNVKRTAALGLGCGAVAVWLAGAATSNRGPSEVTPLERAATVDASGAALAEEIARLHERLRPTTSPLQTRDLFRYGARREAAVAAPIPQAAPIPVSPVESSPLDGLKLVGIAEDTPAGSDTPTRTAIVSAHGELLFVAKGDRIAGRYVVAAIAPEVIELTDEADGRALRLALK